MYPNQSRDFDVKCNHISRRVEIWCGILGISELAFLAQATLIERVGGSFEIRFWTAMSIVWIVWIITLAENYRLVRCGPHARRYSFAARIINRPEFLVRMGFHLLINWSAIGVALFAGFIIGNEALSDLITPICILSTILAWLLFNFLHRQVNRLTNITSSTAIAAALIVAAVTLTSRVQILGS